MIAIDLRLPDSVKAHSVLSQAQLLTLSVAEEHSGRRLGAAKDQV